MSKKSRKPVLRLGSQVRARFGFTKQFTHPTLLVLVQVLFSKSYLMISCFLTTRTRDPRDYADSVHGSSLTNVSVESAYVERRA